MSKTNKFKDASPLVQSVLTLDQHFSELERLSALIASMDLKSEFDLAQTRKLMTHFSEHGEAVGVEIMELSKQLNEARARAEAAAQVVSERAEELKAHQEKENHSLEAFQALTLKVQALNQELNGLKKPEGEAFSEEERAQITAKLMELNRQLEPLIQEAMQIKQTAHQSKLKNLEQSADSLTQSLMAVRRKIEMTTQAPSNLN